jgi:cell division protein FtsW
MTIGKRHENLVLALCVLFLAVLGLVMIYSATNVMAGSSARYGYDPAYFLKRQILFLFGGILAAMGLARLDHDFYRRHIGWVVAASFLLLLLVYLPGIRHSANGASRWINLRYFTFQPSELAKFVLLAFAAWGIDRKGESPKTGYRAFLPLLAVMGVFAVVILKEPDFGMAVVILVSFLAMVFIAGFPWKHLAACAVLGAAGAAVLVLSKPYRIARIHAFLDPISQARTAGYQVVQSLIAFSNGWVLGCRLIPTYAAG